MINSYSNIAVGVDCVIMSTDFKDTDNKRMNSKRGLQVLLMKRGIEPYKGMWSLPGGLVEVDKTLEDTIHTKLFDKVNLDDIHLEQLYTYGDDVNRDPRGRVISVAYLALTNKEKLTSIKSKEYGEVKWFWVKLDNSNKACIYDIDTDEIVGELAFDHYKIITDALIRMQGKVNYTDIAFKLISDKFTIRELQDVYECILNKQVYSFRRFVDSKILETNEYSEVKAHRPAKLYTYKGGENQ